MQVATLIKEGITTKEIAKSLGIAELSVNFHRRNLRLKFGIVNNAINLRSYLSSLSS
jgi:DNA-binding CsgD family transcriptional regulator